MKTIITINNYVIQVSCVGTKVNKNNKAETKSYKMDDGKTVDIPKTNALQ